MDYFINEGRIEWQEKVDYHKDNYQEVMDIIVKYEH